MTDILSVPVKLADGRETTLNEYKGKVVLVGPEIALRAQTQGAFKILFNAIALSAARPANPAQGK